MVVRNQTTEQPAKLRLDGYGTILLDAHGVFLTDYQNLRKAPGFNYGECQLLDKVEILNTVQIGVLKYFDTLILCTCSLKR